MDSAIMVVRLTPANCHLFHPAMADMEQIQQCPVCRANLNELIEEARWRWEESHRPSPSRVERTNGS